MYSVFFKRIIDIIIGLCAFPFVVLFILVFGPIIWAQDKGPIFYAGKRIGRNGKLFGMLKFRSMKVNAPDIRMANGDTYNGDDDPRVTKIGRFMRKTSIDEIPQFINVLLGDMSFIGPRPDTPDFLDVYKDKYPSILSIRPGILISSPHSEHVILYQPVPGLSLIIHLPCLTGSASTVGM